MIGLDHLIALGLLIISTLLSVHSTPVYTGDKRNFNREFMHFGKRAAANYYDLDAADQQLGDHDIIFGKKRAPEVPFGREFMNFGKKRSYDENSPFSRDFMNFGR